MLRELALRTVAEEVGAQAAQYRRTQGLEQAPMPEKVMVCLSSRQGTERLLRTGARVAGRLDSEWYAVYVQTPAQEAGRMDPEAFQRLHNYERMAEERGAKVLLRGSVINRFLSEVRDATVQVVPMERKRENDA
jgi:two-component system sensor histidine kinase KdpD